MGRQVWSYLRLRWLFLHTLAQQWLSALFDREFYVRARHITRDIAEALSTEASIAGVQFGYLPFFSALRCNQHSWEIQQLQEGNLFLPLWAMQPIGATASSIDPFETIYTALKCLSTDWYCSKGYLWHSRYARSIGSSRGLRARSASLATYRSRRAQYSGCQATDDVYAVCINALVLVYLAMDARSQTDNSLRNSKTRKAHAISVVLTPSPSFRLACATESA